VEHGYRLSLVPDTWECTAPARFEASHLASAHGPRSTYCSKIRLPVLLVPGEPDTLRPANFGPTLQAQVPGAQLAVVAKAGHCPHIEHPDLFNRLAIEFLTS
jgi:pimeloyl-ACP methyl ester carboxylesterase